MRRSVWILSILILFKAMPAQDVFENPAAPPHTSAGRVIELEEELRITDESAEFFFQYPSNVQVAEDGSIFLVDTDMLLRFDKNGSLIHNFFQKGQGPGELMYQRGYVLLDGKLCVIGSNPDKILTFGFDGELLDEVVLHEPFWSWRFQFFKSGRFYFFKNDQPETGGKPGVFDAPHVLVSMDRSGVVKEERLSFPYQFFVTGGAWSGQGRLLVMPYRNEILVVAHTDEYLVKLFDMGSQTLLRSFNRKYKRVKPPEDYRWGGVYDNAGKRLGPPPPEYLRDIAAIHVVGDAIWIRTSTRDEEKGHLIDVFDLEGRFIDSFFIPDNLRITGTHDGRIFVRETGGDELVSIVKYRIVQE